MLIQNDSPSALLANIQTTLGQRLIFRAISLSCFPCFVSCTLYRLRSPCGALQIRKHNFTLENDGPTSQSVGQHLARIESTFRVIKVDFKICVIIDMQHYKHIGDMNTMLV